jgi:hypothetical protein
LLSVSFQNLKIAGAFNSSKERQENPETDKHRKKYLSDTTSIQGLMSFEAMMTTTIKVLKEIAAKARRSILRTLILSRRFKQNMNAKKFVTQILALGICETNQSSNRSSGQTYGIV